MKIKTILRSVTGSSLYDCGSNGVYICEPSLSSLYDCGSNGVYICEPSLPVPEGAVFAGFLLHGRRSFNYVVFTVPDWYVRDALYVKLSVSEDAFNNETKKKTSVRRVANFVQNRLSVDPKTIKIGLDWLSFEYSLGHSDDPTKAINSQYIGVQILKQELVYNSPNGPRNFDVEDEIKLAIDVKSDPGKAIDAAIKNLLSKNSISNEDWIEWARGWLTKETFSLRVTKNLYDRILSVKHLSAGYVGGAGLYALEAAMKLLDPSLTFRGFDSIEEACKSINVYCALA